MSTDLSIKELSDLQRQEEFLSLVISAFKSERDGQNYNSVHRIQAEIEHVKDEIRTARPDDLPHLFYQLEELYREGTRITKSQELPDFSSPYFGHMILNDENGEKIIFLGHKTYIDPDQKFRIVDWKNAPISQVYYNYSEGDRYEIDLPTKSVSGHLTEKSILLIKNGKLIRVERGKNSYALVKGEWVKIASSAVQLQGGEKSAFRGFSFGSGATNIDSIEVTSLLDSTQYNILNKDDNRPLLLIGGAGSGKTTVALHRIAKLCTTRNYAQNSVLVAVPQRGLVALSKKLLGEIGLHLIPVTTVHDVFKKYSKRLFADIPKKECSSTPLGVSILKRHYSMTSVLKEFLKRKEREIISRLGKISTEPFITEMFKNSSALPFLKRFQKIEKSFNLTPVQKHAIQREKELLYQLNEDRMEIFIDKELLKNAISNSEGNITNRMVDETILHTTRQMSEKEEGDYSKSTLDGKDLNYGNPLNVQQTIDVEDYGIMLLLLKLKTGFLVTPLGKCPTFNHILLDEAQELSAVDLMVFHGLKKERGSFCVAGDALQQIDKTTGFEGWPKLLEYLGSKDAHFYELNMSYRCPRSIMEYAYDVLGPYAPKKSIDSKKEGPPVEITPIEHFPFGSMLIYDALNELMLNEPKASIAIIANDMKTASFFYSSLKELGHVRLIYDGEFSFKPGLDITTIEQVKGLEFDYVIIPDEHSYNHEQYSRRKLHLAATRAVHQLWVLKIREQF